MADRSSSKESDNRADRFSAEHEEPFRLCSHCESVVRKSGKLLRRVNARPSQSVWCFLCGEYRPGGEFIVIGELKHRHNRRFND